MLAPFSLQEVKKDTTSAAKHFMEEAPFKRRKDHLYLAIFSFTRLEKIFIQPDIKNPRPYRTGK